MPNFPNFHKNPNSKIQAKVRLEQQPSAYFDESIVDICDVVFHEEKNSFRHATFFNVKEKKFLNVTRKTMYENNIPNLMSKNKLNKFRKH